MMCADELPMHARAVGKQKTSLNLLRVQMDPECLGSWPGLTSGPGPDPDPQLQPKSVGPRPGPGPGPDLTQVWS